MIRFHVNFAACFLGLALAFVGSAPVVAQEVRPLGDVITEVNKRVVKIFGSGKIRRLEAYSTGFLVSPQGHIVTVYNHVLDEKTVTIILADGRKLDGKVLGAEPLLDLAVIKVPGEDLPFFDLEKAVAASSGTRVMGFSNMFKVATGDEPVSVLHGVVSARTPLSARKGVYEIPYTGPVYVVDAITNNPGGGGGVLTNRNGDLLGMIGRELRNAQTNTWINYALPVSEMKTTVKEIIEGRFTAKKEESLDDIIRPKRYTALDFGLVMVPDVVFRTPAFVDKVVPDSPAAKAGVQSNDLVLFVNDDLVQSCRSLRDMLGKLEAGDRLQIIIRRGNSLLPLEFTVPKKDVPPTPATRPQK